MSKHSSYVYPGHAAAVADALRVPGREHVAPARVAALEPFQKITAVARQLSNRTDLAPDALHAILDGAEKHVAVLEAGAEAARSLIADARAGIGDRPSESPDTPPDRTSDSDPYPAKQPGVDENEVTGGEKGADEIRSEDRGVMRPSLVPSGPPTEEIVNQPDPPTGTEIQEAGGQVHTDNLDPPTTDEVAKEDDRDDKPGKRRKGK